MDELLRDFLTETADQLIEAETLVVQFERTPTEMSLISGIFRLVHTIKGTSGFIGLARLQRLAHAAETLLGRMRDGEPPTQQSVSLVLLSIDQIRALLCDIEAAAGEPETDDTAEAQLIQDIEAYLARGEAATRHSVAPQAAAAPVSCPDANAAPAAPEPANTPDTTETTRTAKPAETRPASSSSPQAQSGETIRIAVATIENIMRLVSELVLARNQLLELTRQTENDSLKIALQRFSSLTSDLQDSVMRARMQPVSRLFTNLPRLVRELSLDLGKKIEIVTEGGDTELDRQLIEIIRDPLTHIIRNCADHGIEMPEERIAKGKPAHGEIKVRAFQEAGQIGLEIIDDGRGIDVSRVKAKAVASGLAREAELAAMSDEEICRFIFEPGFSTAASVTSVSGRGVGMDVVRTNIESVRGTISLATNADRGTHLTLRIPLTLAIAPALIVEVAGHRFALPQHCVAEVIEARGAPEGNLKPIQGKLMVDLRGDVMPAIALAQILGLDASATQSREPGLVIVLRAGGTTIGLLVDAVADVQEIVVKPMGRSLASLDLFSGHTIVGDGSVLLILDPSGIARGLESTTSSRPGAVRPSADAMRESTRLILFRAGGGVDKVVPTSIVSRIEQISPDSLRFSAAGLVVPYRNELIRVVELAPVSGASGATLPMIVLCVDGTTFGLLVEQIVDVVEDAVGIDLAGPPGQAVGTCRINGEVVDLIDPLALLDEARAGDGSHLDAARRNVLVLSGDPRAIDLIAPLVQAAGYRVSTARSVRAAQGAAPSGSFDAIVMDLAAPAFEAAEAGSLTEWVRGVPVIGLTAGSSAQAPEVPAGLSLRTHLSRLNRAALIEALDASLVRAA